MKHLILACLLALAAPAWAATYYVDTAAASNGDGQLATPWNSLANILTATIAPGDTVCIRGATTGAGWTVPEAGSSATAQEIYDFGCSGWGSGSISATSGTAAVLANKAFTTVKNGTFQCSNCPAVQINASDVTIERNSIPGGDQGIVLTNASVRDRVTIRYNDVRDVQGNGSSDASAAGIYMLHTAATTFTWTDLVIEGNTLINNLQGGINLKCDFGASDCRFTRLTIRGNVVTENDNTGIVLQDCYVAAAASCADNQSYVGEDFTDVVITGNTVTNQTAGGGMAIYGLTASTSAQGASYITNNVCSGNTGVIGGIDLFNSRWVLVQGNVCERNVTTTIDGNGILIDYGNKDVIVRSNVVNFNRGVPGTDNSGVGIMALKCEDLLIHSNVGMGNKAGMFFAGNAFTEANCDAYHNTFVGSLDYGVYVDNSQQASSLDLANNAMDGPGTCIFAEASGAAQTENYNGLGCTTARNFNSVGWTPGANDVVAPALFWMTYPRRSSPYVGAGLYIPGLKDFNRQAFDLPPTLGARRGPAPRATR